MLDKEAILKNTALATEAVNIPEWGGYVTVREMAGTEKDSYESACSDRGAGGEYVNIRAKLVVRSLINGEGKRIFDDGDAGRVGQLSGRILDRLCDVAQRLSGIGAKEAAAVGKDLNGTPPESST